MGPGMSLKGSQGQGHRVNNRDVTSKCFLNSPDISTTEAVSSLCQVKGQVNSC